MTRTAAPVAPLRIALPRALEMLGIGRTTFDSLRARDLFTLILQKPGARSRGNRIFLYPDEVETFALRGEAALLELRTRKGRVTPAERKRRGNKC